MPAPHANKSRIGLVLGNSSGNSASYIGGAVSDMGIEWAGLGQPTNSNVDYDDVSTGSTYYTDMVYAKGTAGLKVRFQFHVPQNPAFVVGEDKVADSWDSTGVTFESVWKGYLRDWLDLWHGTGGVVPDIITIGNEVNAGVWWAGTYAQYVDLCQWAAEEVADFNSTNNHSVEVYVGALACNLSLANWSGWASDLNDDLASVVDGLEVHYYGDAEDAIDVMTWTMNNYAPDFGGYLLGETNYRLNDDQSGKSDSEILYNMLDVMDDASDYVVFFYQYTSSDQDFGIQGNDDLVNGIEAFLDGFRNPPL